MGEGEPGEEVRGAGRRGEVEGGGSGAHCARGGRAGGARTHKRLERARARARARAWPAGGAGARGTLAGGGTGEPPSSPSRPKRETPETAADWLTMAQVVGARETGRLLSSSPLQRFHPPPPTAVISRARAQGRRRCRAGEWGARAGGTDGAGLIPERAPA